MERYINNFYHFKSCNKAVSEVIGAILLLAIVVTLFTVVYSVVLNEPFETSSPTPIIYATVEGNNIVLEHRGGNVLGLNDRINIEIGNQIVNKSVGELLIDSNRNGYWNIGEKIYFPFNYAINQSEADVIAIDVAGNKVVLMGDIDIHPECDLGVKITVDNSTPNYGQDINIKITVYNYWADLIASGIQIKYKLPDALKPISSNSLKNYGYNITSGIWQINKPLVARQNISLIIKATVVRTQLAILLDGSGSITNADWGIMLLGLAHAIENCFPIDGSIELTIIQFGRTRPFGIAQLEIEPIVVNSTNYKSIAKDIMNIKKLGGATPTACAINLATDTLKKSPNYNKNNRQIIHLVTDGKPNCICNVGEYTGVWRGDNETGYTLGKASAEAAKTYLLNKLKMLNNQDEFNAEAVGIDADVDWLRKKIVWPGSYEWTGESPPGSGWVRQVDNYTEFAETLCEKFALLFENMENCATIIYSIPIDSNTLNNFDCLEITPQP